MGRDTSMDGWTRKEIDEKARKDVSEGKHNLPHERRSWWPTKRVSADSEAAGSYERSYEYHKGKKDKD